MENKINNLQKDLEATVSGLSEAYEELALLYRLTETFAGSTVEEICASVLAEALDVLCIKTAAILFVDKEKDILYTQSFKGTWDGCRVFTKDEGVIWNAIKKNKPVAYCKFSESEHKDYLPGAESILICPIIGKRKSIGALVIADKPQSGEFYSNEIKLLRAITSQAGLFIENAMLHKEIEEFFLGTINSFVKALEATSEWTAGHTERVTQYATGIAKEMGLDIHSMEILKICCLLHDIGKITLPHDLLNKTETLTEEEWRLINSHSKVGAEIFEELKAFDSIALGIKYHHEWFNGEKGPFGLKGDDIPLIARILSVADAFDAITSDRPYRGAIETHEAAKEIIRCTGSQFDPRVVNAFLKWLQGFNPQCQVFLP